MHYAITRELAPLGPLAGRADLDGYSASLKLAVDRCMDPDPAARPRTIEALRDLLGIVQPGPVPKAGPAPMAADPVARVTDVPAASAASAAPDVPDMPVMHDAHARPAAPDVTDVPDAPVMQTPAAVPDLPAGGLAQPSAAAVVPPPLPGISSSMPDPALAALATMSAPDRPRRGAGLARWQRWALAAGVAALLVAVVLALFAELRDSGSFDRVVLTLPQTGAGAASSAEPPPPSAMPADTPAAAAASPAASPAALPAPAAAQQAPGTGIAPGFTANPGHRQGGAGAAGGAAYKLLIQPWGVIYVDGVDRGVSPPIKRLELAPGKHTVRVSNPNFHDRELTVDTAEGDGTIAVAFAEDTRTPPAQGDR
ncbi:PEGA domain-containing protein [Massilia sp. TN1-12]|uniref:PEGA domain-containing protein n=1 Tax=Massilia paldalensis TaxID=3377675 RepID=UPI0038502924